jgi:hypothetical protein
VREVLDHDLGYPKPLGFFDDGFARFVVDVTHTSRLFAAAHLAGQRSFLQRHQVVALVKRHPVPHPVLKHNRH